MYILSMNNYSLLPSFLQHLIGDEAKNFDFEYTNIELFSKISPQTPTNHEYIIGIAPYQNESVETNNLQNNMDSIPDAWIFGRNFTLLFEFKIRGTLDEAQLAAHKAKLSNYNGTICLKWPDVITALEKVKKEASEIQRFLIKEFISASQQFKSKRSSSGMPKEIIGGRKKEDDLHFIITGSKETDGYTVDIVFPNGMKKRLANQLQGIQHTRRWIAKFVYENKGKLPLTNVNNQTIITDFCVKPGRIKNVWNQWRLGSYLRLEEK